MVPTIGRIVLFTLNAAMASSINKRREDATAHMQEHRDSSSGVQVHVGNPVGEGDIFPLIITRVWGTTPESAVNGQLLLDGNDTLWVTSAVCGEQPGQFMWPVRS